ncbi:MAG: hypothetical protein LBU32_06735 [Clostridiales bacterium]|nr:hypothetical protein [Clostridiales bacterium]
MNGQSGVNLKRGQSFRDAAFMGIMRWAFYNRLKEEQPNAGTAYGYTAKSTRIRNGLEKDQAVDARCTGGNPRAIPLDAIYVQKALRRCNSQTAAKASFSQGDQAEALMRQHCTEKNQAQA